MPTSTFGSVGAGNPRRARANSDAGTLAAQPAHAESVVSLTGPGDSIMLSEYQVERPTSAGGFVSKNLLFIPGPVTVSEAVLTAAAQPMIDHRGPEYKALLGRISDRLKPVFGTERGEILVLGSSGTGGLEAAVGNLFGEGDRLLACPIGVFGERLIAIARTFGCDVDVLETPWGSAVDPAALRAKLASATGEARYTGVLLPHNDTTPGTQTTVSATREALRG